MNIAIWMAIAASIGFVDLNFQATSKSDKAHTALSRSLAQFDRPSERTMECPEPFVFPKINKSAQKQSFDPAAQLL